MEEEPMSEENVHVNEWINFGMRLGVSSALHPFEYAKVLIQLGYEPIAPRPGRSIFGQRVLFLPNVFQYVKYIKKVDGFYGCFRGLSPKIVGIFIGRIGCEKIALKLGYEEVVPVKEDDYSYETFEKQLKRDVVIHVSSVLLTHPFHVISVRMMAQFIGNEVTYKSLWTSIKEIWGEDGIYGFFSGFMPKVLFDVSCLVFASTTIYYFNKHCINDRGNRQYVASFIQYLYSTIMYPLQVVSICMSVSGSRLKAGRPPQMPIYNNWMHCWRELYAAGEHKRGSSLFWRYYRPTPNYNYNIPFPMLSK